MKTFLFSLVLFALVFALVVVNAVFLETSIADLRVALNHIPIPSEQSNDLTLQLSHLTEVEKMWYQNIFLFSLTISHQDLMEVEQHLSAAIGGAKAGSRDNYITSLFQLDYALSHLSTMSRMSLQNIF